MLRKKLWFYSLLLISLGFEIYMLLSYKNTYEAMINKADQPTIIWFFNIIYSIFVIVCILRNHFWPGSLIFFLSIIRDLILIPNETYTIEFTIIDSIICIMIMIYVGIKEYCLYKRSLIFTPSWTEKNIQERTNMNDSFMTTMTQKFFNYDTDPMQTHRKSNHYCKFCTYVQDNIQVGVQLHCAMCGKELHNEYVSKLCPECAEKHDACVCCGGKMN